MCVNGISGFDIIAPASGLLGVAVGGYFTAQNQKRERQQQRIKDELAEFYSPMLGLRAQVLAKSERAQSRHRGMQNLRAERFPLFEKIIYYNNQQQLAEEIIPAYRKMVDLFISRMHLADCSALQHFPALLEFVEIWNRWLDKSLPPEVLEQLNHSEQKLYPFYEDLASNFARLQQELQEKHGWRW